MRHFNQLTPAEAERLAMLAEEAGEIVQIVGKILRHGYASRHPDNPDGPDNREMLLREIVDFEAVKHLMQETGDVPPICVGAIELRADEKSVRYSHHQYDDEVWPQ